MRNLPGIFAFPGFDLARTLILLSLLPVPDQGVGRDEGLITKKAISFAEFDGGSTPARPLSSGKG